MYLDLLSKVLTNKIYEPDSPKATPDEVDEIKKTLDLLMNDGINLNISAEDLTQILQYTKRSRNIHTYVSIDALNNIRDAITITNAGPTHDHSLHKLIKSRSVERLQVRF